MNRAARVRFAKMQGQGNDFVVIDGVRQRISLSPERIRALADRHFGIGFELPASSRHVPDRDLSWSALKEV